MDDKSLMKRDRLGNFAKGNREGKKFQPGNSGKPKGTRHKKTIAAKKFAEDVLHLNPETGEEMSYKELTLFIAKKADQSPRILHLLLDHLIGKPLERVQLEPKAYIIHTLDQDKIQEGQELDGFTLKGPNAESEEQASLPEGGEI